MPRYVLVAPSSDTLYMHKQTGCRDRIEQNVIEATYKFEPVAHFKCPGADDDVTENINDIIQAAKRFQIPKRTSKAKIYEMTWRMTNVQEEKLRRFEGNILWKMYGSANLIKSQCLIWNGYVNGQTAESIGAEPISAHKN